LDKQFLVSEQKLRFGHTAVVNKNLMYVFGGWDGNITLNDLMAFDLDLLVWLTPANIKG
jgi:hypothetical protein